MSSLPPSPVPGGRLPLDEAIRWMRTRPEYAGTVRDAYLGPDLEDSARRFAASGEFAAVCDLLGGRIRGARVLDLGAGTGIASHAFLQAGAAAVVAVEPDPSELVGRGALRRLCAGLPVEVTGDGAETLSVATASVDVVYARQVLHHLRDLNGALRECARVLRPGGVFLACREHVVDDTAQLHRFLAAHPIHQLAGGEHAFSAPIYRQAITAAGLQLRRELGPWDSVINAYPFVTTATELAGYARSALGRRLGPVGLAVALLPGVESAVWFWLRRPRPGRMHAFFAEKPA